LNGWQKPSGDVGVMPRRFPPPWSIEEIDACFIIRDDNGRALAYGLLRGGAGPASDRQAAHQRISTAASPRPLYVEPEAKIFFSPVSLGSGLWVPKLADEIAAAEAFLLLIGPRGIGPWQKVEYFTAFDRHVNEKAFALVPVIAAGAQAPGLSFLRSLNWVEAPVVTDDKALHQMLAALQGETAATTTPLWKLVHPYRGLEAMTEANADYFFGRITETSGVLNAMAGKPDHLPILIGASGVGKSSVALAGVLSALKAMRWPSNDGTGSAPWPTGLQNSRSWLSLTMRPGNTPLEALAAIFIGLWGLDVKAGIPRMKPELT
jgi:hypothetical protein